MIWDHNVQVIVVLTAMDDPEYPVFWPSSQESYDYGTFRVNHQTELECKGFICRDLSLQSLQDDYDLSLRMIHCPMWPHTAGPPLSNLNELVGFSLECIRESHQGPVCVVDRLVLVNSVFFIG